MTEDVKLSKNELESMLKTLFDQTEYMKGGGVLTSYGFVLSDFIKAKMDMSTLQEVLSERYAKEEETIH
jgi:hypothetical protein